VDATTAALAYLAAGWHPLELPAGAKGPPPEGRTGYDGTDLTAAEVAGLAWAGNLGLRMPPDVIGLDVDAYRGGLDSLNDLKERLGPLPLTKISHSDRGDGSGIRFYRVPVGFAWVAGLPGIDIIQRGHRYAAVAPSVHPDGRAYAWWDQDEKAPTDDIPLVEDLPELPWPWIAALSRAAVGDMAARSSAASGEAVGTFLSAFQAADAPSYISTIEAYFIERTQAGYARHDTMQHCLTWAMECVRAGVAAGPPTVDLLYQAWAKAVAPDARRVERTSARRTTEFEAMLRHAVGKVVAKPEAEMLKMHDDIAGITMHPGPAPAPLIDGYQAEPEAPSASVWIDWRLFAQRDQIPHRWLIEHFWPWGRAMALWAAAKEGKSELALWCAAKLALGEHPWTDAPIDPVDVVYFDFEMTEDDLEDRLVDFNFDLARLERLHYALMPPLHSLDSEAGGREVVGLVQATGAAAVVVDTFGRAVEGEENSADTVRAFYRFTGIRLKQMGVAYLRTDHAGKDRTRGQRGSSAKRDDVDVVWSMQRIKTGVVLDCGGSSRLGWVGPRLTLDRLDTLNGLRYTTPITMGSWPADTAKKAAELDALGVPKDAGRPAAAKALRAAGLKASSDVLAAAIRWRKEGWDKRTKGSDSPFGQLSDDPLGQFPQTAGGQPPLDLFDQG
jgi:hypothetical protein